MEMLRGLSTGQTVGGSGRWSNSSRFMVMVTMGLRWSVGLRDTMLRIWAARREGGFAVFVGDVVGVAFMDGGEVEPRAFVAGGGGAFARRR
jgi:hypothetical protein